VWIQGQRIELVHGEERDPSEALQPRARHQPGGGGSSFSGAGGVGAGGGGGGFRGGRSQRGRYGCFQNIGAYELKIIHVVQKFHTLT
jgi:hypothetical protein